MSYNLFTEIYYIKATKANREKGGWNSTLRSLTYSMLKIREIRLIIDQLANPFS